MLSLAQFITEPYQVHAEERVLKSYLSLQSARSLSSRQGCNEPFIYCT